MLGWQTLDAVFLFHIYATKGKLAKKKVKLAKENRKKNFKSLSWGGNENLTC